MTTSPEGQAILADELAQAGFDLGRSKSGNLLRVDNRPLLSEWDDSVHGLFLPRVLRCPALKELYWRGAELNMQSNGDDNLVAVVGRQKLKVLDFEDSRLGESAFLAMAECPSLQVLNIRGTGVSSECVAAARKIMIGVRIIA